MPKPESQFQLSVHNHLPPVTELHREKMANPYRAGGADMWYSGSGKGSKDLWIEWKFLKVPVRDETVIDLVGGKKPPLSALQQDWLRRRYAEGRNIWVGIGSKDGGVILHDRKWEDELTAKEFRGLLRSRKELANTIAQFVQGK